jgi:hypothetical protein
MQMLQIMPVMGYVAAHAQGMTIGPNILILPPLDPMHVAEGLKTRRWRWPVPKSEGMSARNFYSECELLHTPQPISQRCCRAWADGPCQVDGEELADWRASRDAIKKCGARAGCGRG